MQRIMIVSDTHGKLRTLTQALMDEGKIDKLIHLGDYEGDDEAIANMCGCELLIVPGNNDFFSPYPKEIETEIAGKKILLTHGHYYGVNMGVSGIVDEAKNRDCDVVMFGHTHKPFLKTVDGVTCLNPGSISYPRQVDRRPSYMVIDVSEEGDFEFRPVYIKD